MKIYLAGTTSLREDFLNGKINCSDFSILESFYTINDWQKQLIPKLKSFLLDSGAYTFLGTKKQQKIDFDNYVEQYAEFINKNDIKLFFELDIEEIIGMSEVERLRAKLERLTNKQCIPVWHKTRSKDYYVSLTKEYPYVALGGFAGKEIDFKTYKQALPWFIDTAHQNGAKIHGLGLTKTEVIFNYNFDSVDSTTWLNGAKYGIIYFFDGSKLKRLEAVSMGKRGKDYRYNNLHNLNEWLKLCKYAEKYL